MTSHDAGSGKEGFVRRDITDPHFKPKEFTNCKINNFKYYGGKNGGKICVIYDGEDYMLKFPAINVGISEHGYSNSCISEYIACNVIKTLGLNVSINYKLRGEKTL